MPPGDEPSLMFVRTVFEFYRTHWLPLTLGLGIMSLYLASAMIHGDYWYALVGVIVIVTGVGWLWRRYEP